MRTRALLKPLVAIAAVATFLGASVGTASAANIISGTVQVSGTYPQNITLPGTSGCVPALPSTLDGTVTTTTATVTALHSESIINVAGTDFLLVLDYDPAFSSPGTVNSASTPWIIDDLVVSLTADIYNTNGEPDCARQTLQCSLYADVVLDGTYDPGTQTVVLSGGSNVPGGTAIGAAGPCASPLNTYIGEHITISNLTVNPI